jgi:uncharacterized protein YlzI (FlbEa/FlbD family)
MDIKSKGDPMTYTRVGLYANSNGDYGWANAHVDEMAEKYPGKIVGVRNGQVVVVGDNKEDYEQKVSAYLDSVSTESGIYSVVPVPRREVIIP